MWGGRPTRRSPSATLTLRSFWSRLPASARRAHTASDWMPADDRRPGSSARKGVRRRRGEMPEGIAPALPAAELPDDGRSQLPLAPVWNHSLSGPVRLASGRSSRSRRVRPDRAQPSSGQPPQAQAQARQAAARPPRQRRPDRRGPRRCPRAGPGGQVAHVGALRADRDARLRRYARRRGGARTRPRSGPRPQPLRGRAFQDDGGPAHDRPAASAARHPR